MILVVLNFFDDVSMCLTSYIHMRTPNLPTRKKEKKNEKAHINNCSNLNLQ